MKSFISTLMVSASMLAISPAIAAQTALPEVPTTEVWQAPVSDVKLSDYFAEQIKQREQDSGLQIRIIVTNAGDDLSGNPAGWSVAILRSSLGVEWMRSASDDPQHLIVVLYTADAGTGHGSTGVRVGRALNNVGILPPNLSAEDGPLLPVVRAAQMPGDAEPVLLQLVDNIIAEYKAGHTLRFDRNGVIAATSPAPSVEAPVASTPVSAPEDVASNAPASATTDDDNSGLGWLWLPIGLLGAGVVVMILRALGKRGRQSRVGTPSFTAARDLGDSPHTVEVKDLGGETHDTEAEVRRALAAADAAQSHHTVPVTPASPARRSPPVVPPAPPRRVEPVRNPTPARSTTHSSAPVHPRPSSRVSTPVHRSSSSTTIITGAGCSTIVPTPSAPSCSTPSSPPASNCGGGTGSSGSSCGSSTASSCGTSSGSACGSGT